MRMPGRVSLWSSQRRSCLALVRHERLSISAVALGAFALLALAPSASAATTATFLYTGATQTYVVPPNVTQVRVQAVGADGGGAGGAGGVLLVALNVTPGQSLQIDVGGVGGTGSINGAGGPGGFGGGGSGGSLSAPCYAGGGSGGGGASDVVAYGSRVIVAGGGGGSSMTAGLGGAGGGGATSMNGGAGAGDGGGALPSGGGGGTSSAGGSGGSGGSSGVSGASGSFGSGGAGASDNSQCSNYGGAAGGGGGGGYYGGVGGGAESGYEGDSGGGGSSYVGPGATLISAMMGSGQGSNGEVTVTAPADGVNQGLQVVNNALAKGGQEVSCVEGQVSNPNSSTPDPLGLGACGDVGTGVQIVDSVVNDVGTVVSQEQQDAGCTESQIASSPPTPASNEPACQETATAVRTVKQGTSGALYQNPTPGSYSNSCTSPSATVANGYVGSTYVDLQAQPNPSNPSQEWVCYRISNGPSSSLNVGGRMDISAAIGTPSLGTTPATCSTDGYAAPPLSGTFNGQPFLVGASTPSGQVIVCLQYGSTGYDLVVPTSTGSSPLITVNQDASLALPSPTSDPYPSGTCQSGTAGTPTQLANMNTAGAQMWAYESRPSSGTIDLCARLQGPVSFGGMASVTTTPSTGVQPTFGSDGNVSACTNWPLTLSSPVAFAIGYSGPGGSVQSICEGSSTTSGTRYYVGTTGSGVPGYVSWTPDPGTP